MTDLDTSLRAVANRLAQSERVLFITGAGISADSGLPTYRGLGGLYNDGTTDEGLPIEDALSGDTLARRPELTWKYLAQIADNCHRAQPNAAHHAIAALQERMDRVVVFTQNIDGLHRHAGSETLIEIHGNLDDLYCTVCDHQQTMPDLRGQPLPPHCPSCGGVLRPNVVLFGEALPEDAMDNFLDACADGIDMVFSIGTSSVFPYIIEPVIWAINNNIPTVEINPTATQLSRHVDYHLPIGAAEAMSKLLELLDSTDVD